MRHGHLFVTNGDMKKIHCDAWLLPTDTYFNITSLWLDVTGLPSPGRLTGFTWKPDSQVLFFGNVNGADVWLGRIGHESNDVFAQTAEDFIVEASHRLRSQQTDSSQSSIPRLAINHIGTGRGGAAQAKWNAITAVSKRVKAVLVGLDEPVDVIQVAWGEKAEAAAQNIRMKIAGNSPESSPMWHFYLDNDEKHKKARDLANEMRRSNVAVFMGAGVSAGAGLADWSTLLEELRKDADIDPHLFAEIADNRDKAEVLTNRLGKEKFLSGLKLRLESSKHSLQHSLLASLPCNEFLTTNVDTLFEQACNSQKQQRALAVLPIYEDTQLANRWLLKIHGSITDEDSLVFSRTNYLDSFRSNRALMGVLQASLLTRHMLFVGYGLKDEDFHELVHEVRNAFPNSKPGRPLGTVLTLFNDPLHDELWKDTVNIVHMRERPSAPRDTIEGKAIWDHETREAIRELEIFLDLVGMLSSNRSAFLLDDQYGEEWSKDESELADILRDVMKKINQISQRGVTREGSAWESLYTLLQSLGADFDSD